MSAKNGRIRSVDELVLPAVTATVADAISPAEDSAYRLLGDNFAAVARLAQRYAAQIDDAALIAADAAEVDASQLDKDALEQLHRLQKRVAAQEILSDLGPKLLATLESALATPKSRLALQKGGKADDGPGILEKLRNARPA